MAAKDEHAALDTLRLSDEEVLRPDDTKDSTAAGPAAKASGAGVFRAAFALMTIFSTGPFQQQRCVQAAQRAPAQMANV